MCGITAIFNKSAIACADLIKSNATVSHRGPDDEGYVTWSPGEDIAILAGKDTSPSTLRTFRLARIRDDVSDWKVGLGHRRLSILDLSPSDHQPMTLASRGLVITFNGEVFNYLEIRKDLEELGHRFHTGTDTEVMLHAWAEWGQDALHRFNGMFAFVLLDTRNNKLYAVRDRFGVKPLYYTNTPYYVAFGSEVKQLRVLPGYRFHLQEQIAYDYLRYGLIDHAEDTFDTKIKQVLPGHLVTVNIGTGDVVKSKWYTLEPHKWEGSEAEACERFYGLLKDSVRLRMRSDVPVGSALSGGLDSSTIVCLMRAVLEDQGMGDHLIKTVTSCQEDKKYDEWEYAEEVIRKVKAEPFKVFPSFEKLQEDLSRMMWHMDYPFGSTSQFSQWCVFESAKKQGLTVMIDGQGADEQLAGYGGNDMALYTGLLGRLKFGELFREVKAYHAYKGQWPASFVIGAAQHYTPTTIRKFIPDRYWVRKNHPPVWMKAGISKPLNDWPGSLRRSLFLQVTRLPLPSLLRYEDRNSMAFSIESRVPFMDYRLIEFTLGLPERMVYREGERKYILRKTFRGVVPDKILDRKDKMGFLSAEERWVKEEGKEWFRKMVEDIGSQNNFVRPDKAIQVVENICSGRSAFNHDLWRMINLSAFLKAR